MEESVWTDPVVDSFMHKKFIVVSLYVDERRKLPIVDQVIFKTSSGIEKSIVTVGDKWATFQTENFGATSQPQYAIISPDGYINSNVPGWINCRVNVIINEAMGAQLCQTLITAGKAAKLEGKNHWVNKHFHFSSVDKEEESNSYCACELQGTSK